MQAYNNKREVQYTLCRGKYIRKAYSYNTCNLNKQCSYTSIKCTNCKDTLYLANSKLYKIYLSIKTKVARPSFTYRNPFEHLDKEM